MEVVTEQPSIKSIPKGYKRTEVGVLPEDWEVRYLGPLSSLIGDGIHSTPNYSESGDYFFINGNNLLNGKIKITEDTKKVDTSEFRKHGKNLNDSTILLSINGTIGNLAYYQGEPVMLGKSAAYINLGPKVFKEYIFYQLQTRSTKNFFENNLTGTTIKNLGLGTIKNTPIPFPTTLEEQQAIAEALSDVDELIAELDALIEKKQQVKKGAMQQLLTGKKRLPGFDGEWEEKRIHEIAEVNPESLSTNTPKDYTFKYISLEDVDSGVVQNFSITTFENAPSRARRILRKEDVVFATVRPNLKSHFYASNIISDESSMICSTGFTVIRVKKGVNAEYVYNHLFGDYVNQQVDKLIAGSNYPAINNSDVGKLEVPLPPTCDEQKAIADILSDMDAEIQSLQSKRAKYEQIKQGMMQELLTGKTRLV